MPARIKPFMVAAFGARGTGKTVYCKRVLAASKCRRVMVWDFKHDSDLSEVGRPFTSWPAFVAECCKPAFVARYLVSPDHDPAEQFDAFCALAWREGNLVLFVDELAEVTKANKAPAAWRRVVNVGRNYANGSKALAIIGASQRPSEVDKSFIGNCDVIHTGRLGYANDARLFAGMWGVDYAELTNLPDLHWLEKRADAPGVARGVLTFGAKSVTKVTKQATGKPAAPAPKSRP